MRTHEYKMRSLCGIAFVISSAFFLTMQTVFFPLSKRIDFNDSAIYQYIGYLLCTERVPYVDAFDHKGLYFYFINAVGYFISPKWGMWPLIWVTMAIIIAVVYKTAKKFLNSAASFYLTAIIVTGIAAGFWDGDTPDYFAMALNFIAFYILSDYFFYYKLSSTQALLVGVLTAGAFWMKQNLIIGTIVVCGCIIIDSFIQKQFKKSGEYIIAFMFGFALASLPAIGWLYYKNAIHAMIDNYFLFNFKYMDFHPTTARRMEAFSYFITRPSILPVVICTLTLLLSMLKNVNPRVNCQNKKMFVFGVISFIITIILLVLPGNAYVNYVLSLFPPALLIYISTLKIISTIDSFGTRIGTVLLITACVLIAGLNLRTEYSYLKSFWKEKPQEAEERAYIIENSDKDDNIAIISPHYVGLYIAASRDSATRDFYVQLSHFENLEESLDTDVIFWNDYLNSLRQSKPRMILLDRHYYNNENLNILLREILDQYIEVGKSTNFRFYVRERFEGEHIPAFVSKTTVLEDEVLISVPSEMIEAYQNGEITIDDFMTLFDKQWENGQQF